MARKVLNGLDVSGVTTISAYAGLTSPLVVLQRSDASTMLKIDPVGNNGFVFGGPSQNVVASGFNGAMRFVGWPYLVLNIGIVDDDSTPIAVWRATTAAEDAEYRFMVKGDGKHWWGDGAAPQDTNLYRASANTLKTDDLLDASTAGLRTKHESAATPTGGSSGEVRVGTDKLWANDGGTWKSTALAAAGAPSFASMAKWGTD